MSQLCVGNVPYEVTVEVDCDNNPTGIISYTNVLTGNISLSAPVGLGLCGVTTSSILVCEDVQDCISGMLTSVGFTYNDIGDRFRSSGLAGQFLISDGVGGATWQAFTPGGVAITSPLNTIAVGGTGAAPTIDVSWSNTVNVEGVQDAIAPMFGNTGFVYSDSTNSIVATGIAGQVLTASGAGVSTWVTPTVVTPFTCENVQDCIGSMLVSVGFDYNDNFNLFTSFGSSGQFLIADGLGGSSWQTYTPGGISLSSPLLTVSVGGTGSAPTVDVNWSNAVNVEGVQDAIGSMFTPVGFVYADSTNQISALGSSGQVLTSNGAGVATWVSPAAVSVPSYNITGRNCDATTSSQSKASTDSLNFVFTGGQGSVAVTKVGTVVTATISVQRPKLRTVSGASGSISTAVTDVFVVTALGTDVVLTTPSTCDPTDIWVKNQSNDLIYIVPAFGTIDGETYVTLNPAGPVGGGGNGYPTVHLNFNGAGWSILGSF